MLFRFIHGSKRKGKAAGELANLKDNLAFMPFLYFFNIIGIDLLRTSGKDNKISRFVHSTLMLSSIILLIWLLSDDDVDVDGGEGDDEKKSVTTTANIVVGAITCINNSCINLTFIIVYASCMIKSARKSTHSQISIFEHFNRIDTYLKSFESINSRTTKKLIITSKCFVQILFLVLFIGTHCRFVGESFNDKTFNVGQFLHVMLVFILSVEILFYCMICASIKARFIALHKYLRRRTRRKSSEIFDSPTISTGNRRLMMVTSKSHDNERNENFKYVSSQSDALQMNATVGNINNDEIAKFKNISRIYDEVLQIISQMNESFSVLLSVVFGEYWVKVMKLKYNEFYHLMLPRGNERVEKSKNHHFPLVKWDMWSACWMWISLCKMIGKFNINHEYWKVF